MKKILKQHKTIAKFYNDNKKMVYENPSEKKKYVSVCRIYLNTLESFYKGLEGSGRVIDEDERINTKIERELLKKLEKTNLKELLKES